jgi:mRNA interferase MazF
VIINAAGIGRLPLRMVVPLTEWDDRYARYVWMVRVDPDTENGLSKSSTADTFQIRPVSLDRFLERLGVLPEALTDQIAEAVAICVDAP